MSFTVTYALLPFVDIVAKVPVAVPVVINLKSLSPSARPVLSSINPENTTSNMAMYSTAWSSGLYRLMPVTTGVLLMV